MMYLLALLFSTLAQSAGCVDLTGDYSAPASRLPEARRVYTLRQSGCESISLGSYRVVNGSPADETAPRLLYVNENQRGLCPSCVGFAVLKDGLEIKANAVTNVGRQKCKYNKVKWSLKGRDLLQSYSLVGETSACKKAGPTYTKVLDRFR